MQWIFTTKICDWIREKKKEIRRKETRFSYGFCCCSSLLFDDKKRQPWCLIESEIGTIHTHRERHAVWFRKNTQKQQQTKYATKLNIKWIKWNYIENIEKKTGENQTIGMIVIGVNDDDDGKKLICMCVWQKWHSRHCRKKTYDDDD